LLDYENYTKVLNDCDIALSFRNPNDDEHNYNFPSKILEYLSKSKIVISTKKYKDLPNSIIYYTDYNLDSLTETFESIYSMDFNEIVNVKSDIYKYLRANFTQEHTLKILNELIDD
jgi:hypothetical protein